MTDDSDKFLVIDYEPGQGLGHDGDVKLVNKLSYKQMLFLDYYAETLDFAEAASKADVAKGTVTSWLKLPHIQDEIEKVYEVYRKNRLMKASNASVNLLEVLERIKNDYDEADPELRSKFANPMVKASEVYIKATQAKEDKGAGTNIQINIDLGQGAKDVTPVIDIEGEK